MSEDSGCGCRGNIGKIRQIEINGQETGITGVLELFKRYYNEGKNPEEVNANELLKDFEEMNYIPEKQTDEYREALMREYQRYCKDRKEGRPPKLLKK